MTEQLSMTAAELAFLLASGDGRSPAPRLLGLTDADRADAVLNAGLGSLLLRHLAAPAEGRQLELAPALAAIAGGLHRPRSFIQVSLAAGEHTESTLLIDAEVSRFLVAARAYRTYDITPVDPDVDIRDRLIGIAEDFLTRHRPGVATFNASSAVDVTRGTPPCRATLASTADGGWRFAGGTERESTATCTLDEARTQLNDELARFLPHLALA